MLSHRPCAVAGCGRPSAGLGLRLPGPFTALPAGRRGYLWACSRACLAVLEARRARVTLDQALPGA